MLKCFGLRPWWITLPRSHLLTFEIHLERGDQRPILFET